MDKKKIDEMIERLKKQEYEMEKRELELSKRYHEGVRDGFEAAAEEFAKEEGENREEQCYEEGFMDALTMLCKGEFGVDVTKTRANTKGGIVRSAARLIRGSMSDQEEPNDFSEYEANEDYMNIPE